MIGLHCFFVPFYKKFNNNLPSVESKFDVEKGAVHCPIIYTYYNPMSFISIGLPFKSYFILCTNFKP